MQLQIRFQASGGYKRSGSRIRVQVKQLFVIHQPGLHVVEKTDSSDNVDREGVRFGKVDNSFPFQITDSQFDFVSVCLKRAGSRAEPLRCPALKIKTEKLGLPRLKDAKLTASIEFRIHATKPDTEKSLTETVISSNRL